MNWRIEVKVVKVKGYCPLYKVGDRFTIEKYYITNELKTRICIHALSSMLTLASPFLHGVSARELGIGDRDDIGYIQCPDPGEPYTCGGTVTFELRREPVT